jgi:hypothetical protein
MAIKFKIPDNTTREKDQNIYPQGVNILGVNILGVNILE